MNAAQLENARKSTAAVHSRQHLAARLAHNKLIEALTFKQYQACRVNGFFLAERVAKVTRSLKLRHMAAEVIYLENQLDETSHELDAVLDSLQCQA